MQRKTTILFSALAAAFIASAANAGDPQTGYDLRIVTDRSELSAANPTANLTLQVAWLSEGGFGPTGFDGAITASENLLAAGSVAAPYRQLSSLALPNLLTLNLENPGSMINPSLPNMGMPLPHGVDAFVDIYTFSYTATDFSSIHSVQIGAASSASNILSWKNLIGLAWVAGDTSAEQTTSTTLDLRVVPAPGSAALASMGLLMAAPRRRR